MASCRQFLPVCALFSIAAISQNSAFAGHHYPDPIPSRAAISANVPISTWSAPVYKFVLTPCGGGTPTDHVVDTTLGPTTGVVLPQGCWEAITVVFDGDLTVTGYTPTNYALSVSLEATEVDLIMNDDLQIVSGSTTDMVIFEFLAVDWYQDELSGYVSTTAPVTVDGNHARHAALLDNLETGSRMLLSPL